MGDINVLALTKGKEKYIYLYEDSEADIIVQVIEEQARNPDLSLGWEEATVLCMKIVNTLVGGEVEEWAKWECQDLSWDVQD